MMLRYCNGNDPGLLREDVHPKSDARTWRLCDCQLEFDDAQRTVIYPHHFIRVEDKERLFEMVKAGLSAEQIREELTRQPSVNYPTVNQPRSNEGNIMGEGSDFRADGDSVTGTTPADESGAPSQIDENSTTVDRHGDENDSEAAVSGDASTDEAAASEGDEPTSVSTFGGSDSDRN